MHIRDSNKNDLVRCRRAPGFRHWGCNPNRIGPVSSTSLKRLLVTPGRVRPSASSTRIEHDEKSCRTLENKPRVGAWDRYTACGLGNMILTRPSAFSGPGGWRSPATPDAPPGADGSVPGRGAATPALRVVARKVRMARQPRMIGVACCADATHPGSCLDSPSTHPGRRRRT